MKITLLNGALPDQHQVDALASAVEHALQANGAEVNSFKMADQQIGFCLGCFQCWTHSPGHCRIDDNGRQIARSTINSDWLLLVCRNTFGGYSSALKKGLDRLIPLILPFFKEIEGETHHQPRYDSYPSIAGINMLTGPAPGLEAAFDDLVRRNGINLQSPSVFSQAVYSHQDFTQAASQVLSRMDKSQGVLT